MIIRMCDLEVTIIQALLLFKAYVKCMNINKLRVYPSKIFAPKWPGNTKYFSTNLNAISADVKWRYNGMCYRTNLEVISG